MISKRILEPVLPTLVVLFASVFLFGGVVYAQSTENSRPLSVNKQIIEQRTQEVKTKSEVVYSTNLTVNTLQEKTEALQSQLETEKQKIAELKQKIQNKKAAEARATRVVVRASVAVNTAPVGNCGDNYYASYIYGMESGGRVVGNCSTTARNAGGCYGIGQACPGSKIAHCGSDYACQNAWFTNYAIQRYGSWENAYNFHKTRGWW